MMGKRMKSVGVVLLTAAMTIGMLTGCSSGNSNSNGSTAVSEGADSSKNSSVSNAETVELTMWGTWGGDQVAQLEAQLEAYNASQDKIHITYAVQDGMEQKLLTAIASNEVPDVVLWDRFNTSVYAPKGAFTQLDDLVANDDSIDMSDFYEPAVDELTYDGKLYGIPLTVDTRILFYNKDMFEEAGVDPESITDWDSLREAAIKLTIRENGKLVQAGFSLKDTGLFNNWIVQAGGRMINNDTTPPTTDFNTQAGLDVLAYWDQLQNVDKVYDLGFEDGYGGDGFKAGKVAITFNGPWTLESYREADINFGVIGQPAGPSGNQSAMMGGFGLIIPNKAKNTEAAWEFIKWWTTQPENGVEFAKISGNLPASKEAAKDPYFVEDEILQVFTAAMDYAGIRSKVPGYSDVEGLALIPQLQKFVAGEITAEKALSEAQTQGDAILSKAAVQ